MIIDEISVLVKWWMPVRAGNFSKFNPDNHLIHATVADGVLLVYYRTMI